MKKYLSIRVVEAESLEEAEEEVKKGNFLEDDPRCDLVIEDEKVLIK